MPPLVVISRDAADLFNGGRCRNGHLVDTLDAVRGVLVSHRGTTLDLVGHSTRAHHFLRIGQTPIDMLDRKVEQFFTDLVADDLLAGFSALRLLGCETAISATGKHTLRRLEQISGLPVWGTTKVLIKSHYDENGFKRASERALVAASRV